MSDWWLLVLWWLSGAGTALIVREVVAHKRPRKCPNCSRRPRWAFDRTPRGGSEILRDHVKGCVI